MKVTTLLLFTACSASSQRFMRLEERVQSILNNMSVAEKARQLVIHSADEFITDGDFDAAKAASFLGSLGAGVFDNLGRNVDPLISNLVQRAAVNSSRFGVGVIIAEECQHGVQGDWHTMFPSPITLAATFDVQLMRDIGRVIGTEARASGITQCWSPVCGLAREPRWGRSEEEFGEDTFLAGELAGAMAAGMVGDGNLTAADAVSPLIKHFAGYSVPQGGHNSAPSTVGGTRSLLAEYLPVFRKAIAGGAQGVMSSYVHPHCAPAPKNTDTIYPIPPHSPHSRPYPPPERYNEIDGVPTSGDPWLLTDVLRGQLGFDGYVSSDFGAIVGLGPKNHAVAVDDADCVRQFLEAGGALNGHDFEPHYEDLIVSLISSGAMSEAVLDRAAGDVLRVKARLGLLEGVGPDSPAIVDPARVATFLGDNASHVATALRAAQESVVVVANSDNALPLPVSLKTVLVVGPNADAIRAGDYSAAGWAGGSPNGGGNIDNANARTVLQSLKALLPGAIIQYAPAANLFCAQQSDPTTLNTPLWTTVQQHSLHLASQFSPTAPSSPFLGPETPVGVFPSGTPGLAATYYADENSTAVSMTRLDAAPNFHWFALGPDMWRSRSRTFRVRWEGTITSDATVKSGGLKANACSGSACPGDGRVMGTRVWLDGSLVIDAWAGGNSSCTVDWVRGVGRQIAIEYWQDGAVDDSSFFLQWSLLSTLQSAGDSISEAIALSATADVVIAVVGGANNDHACTTEGEGVDRASLNLGGTQTLLLEGLASRGRAAPPLVTVLMGSKPATDAVLDDLPTVVAAFQGGQACGQAVAEVLLGVVEPSGRLPITFPVSADVLPVYYSKRKSRNDGSFCDVEGSVVRWPFGHGLAYTTFNVSLLTVLTPTVPANGTAVISVVVANVGTRAGWAVPQLYLRRTVASVTTPELALKGFARALLQPGENVTTTFSVNVAEELEVWGRDLVSRVETGNVSAFVGFSSANLPLSGAFLISG